MVSGMRSTLVVGSRKKKIIDSGTNLEKCLLRLPGDNFILMNKKGLLVTLG